MSADGKRPLPVLLRVARLRLLGPGRPLNRRRPFCRWRVGSVSWSAKSFTCFFSTFHNGRTRVTLGITKPPSAGLMFGAGRARELALGRRGMQDPCSRFPRSRTLLREDLWDPSQKSSSTT